MKNWFSTILELSKFRITSFSTLTTIVGYILFKHRIDWQILIPTIGVLFLACGSAVLNQYQERDLDAQMARTKSRPIPSGRVSANLALLIALLFVLIGAIILLVGANLVAFGLGLLAVFWYNGVYTLLKQKTAFAVVPGALIGSIPPAIGWVAGGGNVFDSQILIFSFFFFIWQVPHFWLLLLIYGKDYEQAGFPSLSAIFSREQLQRITFIWIFATAITCLIIPLFGLVQYEVLNFILIGSAVWMVWTASKLLGVMGKKQSFGQVFRGINIYALIVIVLLTVDKLIYF